MLAFLPPALRASITLLFFALNTFVCCLFIYPFAFLRLISPVRSLRSLWKRAMVRVAETWISINGGILRLTQKVDWQVTGLEDLHYDRSYLVIANHQSWMDILILQNILNRKIPFIRFFIKYELIYFPFLGWAWWALDFPFMKRHSKEYLARHPEKKNDDMESTLKACRHFKGQTVSILNFLEGTRFTNKKHGLTKSSFKNLLQPKAGGLAFVLNAMGNQFDSILDVTIYYPHGPVSLWEALKGQMPAVKVGIRKIPIPLDLLTGNYLEDFSYRTRLQTWVQSLWLDKDQHLNSFKQT
jgi:1-acyl-sn-glycerol-3-phosphate acyltransferase